MSEEEKQSMDSGAQSHDDASDNAESSLSLDELLASLPTKIKLHDDILALRQKRFNDQAEKKSSSRSKRSGVGRVGRVGAMPGMRRSSETVIPERTDVQPRNQGFGLEEVNHTFSDEEAASSSNAPAASANKEKIEIPPEEAAKMTSEEYLRAMGYSWEGKIGRTPAQIMGVDEAPELDTPPARSLPRFEKGLFSTEFVNDPDDEASESSEGLTRDALVYLQKRAKDSMNRRKEWLEDGKPITSPYDYLLDDAKMPGINWAEVDLESYLDEYVLPEKEEEEGEDAEAQTEASEVDDQASTASTKEESASSASSTASTSGAGSMAATPSTAQASSTQTQGRASQSELATNAYPRTARSSNALGAADAAKSSEAGSDNEVRKFLEGLHNSGEGESFFVEQPTEEELFDYIDFQDWVAHLAEDPAKEKADPNKLFKEI